VSGIYNFVLFFGIASVKLEHQRGRSHYSNLPLLVAVCCHGTWKSNFNLWHSYIHSNIKHQKTLWKKKPCIFGFFKILQHFSGIFHKCSIWTIRMQFFFTDLFLLEENYPKYTTSVESMRK